MKKFATYLFKCIIAGAISLVLLSLFSLVYYNPPIATEQPDSVTNYRFVPNKNWSFMLEGVGFGKTDNLGYNNAYYNECLTPDIVFIGSSHLEALQVPQDANPGTYKGSVEVTSAGKTKKYAYSVKVLDRVLPAPKEWAFHLDLWQNPYCKPFKFVYDLGIGDKKDKGVTNGKSVTETVSYHYETTEEERLMNSIFQGIMTDKQVINYMNNHFWKKLKEDYQQGNRQSSLLRKAAQLCKYGVLYENALEELKYRYCYAGLEEEEVESKVAYCYSSNVFGSNRKEILEMREDSKRRKNEGKLAN